MIHINYEQRNVLVKFSFQPYWIVDFPDENIVYQIASRAVSLRFCLELWAQGKQNKDLHHSLRAYSIENSDIIAEDRKSFKIVVETFCKHFSQHEKVNKIEVSKYFNIKFIYYLFIISNYILIIKY